VIRALSAQQKPLMGRREQCTYRPGPRLVRCIYNTSYTSVFLFHLPPCVSTTAPSGLWPPPPSLIPSRLLGLQKKSSSVSLGSIGMCWVFALNPVVINTGGQPSWEYCISLWFEGRVLTRKYPLTWPLVRPTVRLLYPAAVSPKRVKVPYFLARYSGLASLIAK